MEAFASQRLVNLNVLKYSEHFSRSPHFLSLKWMQAAICCPIRFNACRLTMVLFFIIIIIISDKDALETLSLSQLRHKNCCARNSTLISSQPHVSCRRKKEFLKRHRFNKTHENSHKHTFRSALSTSPTQQV